MMYSSYSFVELNVSIGYMCWCSRFELPIPDRNRHVPDIPYYRIHFPVRLSRSRQKNLGIGMVRGFSRLFPTIFIPNSQDLLGIRIEVCGGSGIALVLSEDMSHGVFGVQIRILRISKM